MNYLLARLKNPDLIELLGSDMVRIFYFKNEEGQSKYALIENDLPTSVKMSVINHKVGYYALSDPEQAKGFPFIIDSQDLDIYESRLLTQRQSLIIHLRTLFNVQENIWNHLSYLRGDEENPSIPSPSELDEKYFTRIRQISEALKGQAVLLEESLKGIKCDLEIIAYQNQNHPKTAA